MAKSADDDRPRKKGKASSVLVFVLLALLILGLAGFGVTGFGGRVSSIGRVGDREITTGDYVNALRGQLAALSRQVGQQVTLQQGLAFGIDAQVRGQLVTAAALANEADRLGLSAGDARVAGEVTRIPAFQGPAGAFDPDAYRFALERIGMAPADFEAQVRDDLARSLLVGAVGSGFAAPAGLADTLFAYVAETRGFGLLPLSEADLSAPPPAPDAAALQAFYQANIADFTRAEARRITYVALQPGELAPTLQVDETTLRGIYDARIDEFVQPERRLVERLVFPDRAAADAARARLDAGTGFDALVAERGLALVDIDLGDVAREDLGAAGDAVFAMTAPGVVGPIDTDLGPALFRMNAILAAQETTFEEARVALAPEAALDAARRQIDDRREALDDALAGGATLEDLAAEQGMTLATIDLRPDSDTAIAGYPAFRDAVLAAEVGDFPELIALDDGGLAALRLDAIVPPEPIPFAEAEPAVAEAFRAQALNTALVQRGEEIRAAVEGGARLGTFGIAQTTARIARNGSVPGAPPEVLQAVFAMAPGTARVVAAGDYVAVVVLDSVMPADVANPDQAQLRAAIAAQAEAALAEDALALFGNALVAEAGVTLDDAAIAAVHASVQ